MHKCVFKQEKSPIVLPTKVYFINECVMYEEKDETNWQECQAKVISIEDDKKCQSTLCSDKNCQDTKYIHMQLAMKKSSHMWLAKPATLQSSDKKKKYV